MTTVGSSAWASWAPRWPANLVKAGFDVVGYNRTPDKVAGAGRAGRPGRRRRCRGGSRGRRRRHDAAGLAGRARGARPVDGGVFENAKPGLLSSTSAASGPTSPRARCYGPGRGATGARRTGVRRRGGRDRGQPVDHGRRRGRGLRGCPAGAEAVGKTIVHVGPAGAGQTVKAANQLIVAGNIELLAEALVFLEAYGVDTEAALEFSAVAWPAARCWTRRANGCSPASSLRASGIELHHKDLGIVTGGGPRGRSRHPARRGRRPARCAALVARGDGGLDHSGLFKLVEELSGRDGR